MPANHKIPLFFTATLVLAAFFLIARPAAATTSTVRGAAWWGSTNQYLYLNCLDDVTGDRLGDPYNLCGGSTYGSLGNYLYCAPYMPNNVFHFYSTPCSNLVHGVYIADNGNFSGSAWNYNRGLVDFFATTTPPDGQTTIAGCPSPSQCQIASGCSACYNEDTQEVHGWARVENDGTWVKLNTPLDNTGNASTTGVQIKSWNLASSTTPYYSLNPGDFIGDATTTSDDISFNCLSEGGQASGGTCATRNYKVYISNLQVGHLAAPNWSYAQACTSGALNTVLTWQLKSGTPAGYEIVVNNSSSFSTSTNNYVCWSGIKSPSVATQYVLPNSDPNCHSLNYNTDYYWWIRLFDASSTPTQWYEFGAVDGHNGNEDTHTNTTPDPSQLVFATYKHEFPGPYFTYSPPQVLVGTSTYFTSIPNSVYYTAAAPTAPQSCGASGCHYLWSATDPEAIISSPTAATTTITFQQATGTIVNFNLTDSDNYVCSTSTNFTVTYPLPIWREIKAQ